MPGRFTFVSPNKRHLVGSWSTEAQRHAGSVRSVDSMKLNVWRRSRKVSHENRSAVLLRAYLISHGIGRGKRVHLQPKRTCIHRGINVSLLPPVALVSMTMELPVVAPAQRYAELIANFASRTAAAARQYRVLWHVF